VEAPPEESHVIQELGLDVEPGDREWRGEARVPAGAWAPGTSFPRASVLLTYADIIAGAQYRALTLPRMSVTVDLSLDVMAPDAATLQVDRLLLTSRILRQGKRTAVTETSCRLPDGRVVAVCSGSFAMISSTFNALPPRNGPEPSRFERPLLPVPVEERAGIEVPAPGRAELAMRPGLGNSTGSMMGGLTGILGEVAALSRAQADGPGPYFADRLLVRYLAPVRTGPARAVAVATGGSPARPVVRVDLRDGSRPEEMAADITVGLTALG
jgi:acyl-coenzyme A thioesterase PaaI-like protein